ncbi:MAG: hydrogenase maturation protease [Bacteroidetes bacterium]|nr:hydrogenase maturation protease [Bacteroidota bacterium]
MTGKVNKGKEKPLKLLLYGYGNPGRQDDGLGNEFIYLIERWIEKEGLPNIEVDSNYQLNIEDADAIANMDIVIFVDASIEPIKDFTLTKVNPSASRIEFTMHTVSASFILDLCHKIYERYPETYLLHIKGYEWEFKEGITDAAQKNLDKAIDFLKGILKNPQSLKRYNT